MVFNDQICSMNGYEGFGVLGSVIGILIIVAISLGIALLVKKLNEKEKKGK